jgi:hypothetical protein
VRFAVPATIDDGELGLAVALGLALAAVTGVAEAVGVGGSVGVCEGDAVAEHAMIAAAIAAQAPSRIRIGQLCRVIDQGSTRWAAGLIGSYPDLVSVEFSGEIWFWQGPAPWYFVTVPDEESRELAATSAIVSYGWGMIPVTARIGATRWKTSLFPKDGRYVVPVKATVRNAEALAVGDTVTVRLAIDV